MLKIVTCDMSKTDERMKKMKYRPSAEHLHLSANNHWLPKPISNKSCLPTTPSNKITDFDKMSNNTTRRVNLHSFHAVCP